jgi:hypothetical protein
MKARLCKIHLADNNQWRAPMRKTQQNLLWVVYKMTVVGKYTGMNAVCEQSEWDAMELARPGYHTLVKSGIADEAEAERLARGTSGDAIPRKTRDALLTKPFESPTTDRG